MPVELADLILKRTRTLAISLGESADGEPLGIVVKWSPEAYTQPVHHAITEANNKPEQERDPFEMAERIVVPLVKSWDLTVDGKPYEVTKENAAALGLFILQDIVNAITSDFAVARDTKKSSGDGS